jgi:hypothetical protein
MIKFIRKFKNWINKFLPRKIGVWSDSRLIFVFLIFVFLLMCIFIAIFSKNFSWLAISLPLSFSLIVQRYFDDMKDVRDCERKLFCSLNKFQQYLRATEELLLVRYDSIIKLDTTKLKHDVDYEYDFEKNTKELANKLNEFVSDLTFACHSPIDFIVLNHNVQIFNESMDMLNLFIGNMYCNYADTLHAAKVAIKKNRDEKIYNELIKECNNFIEMPYHKTPEYYNEIKGAFDIIKNLKIVSLFG